MDYRIIKRESDSSYLLQCKGFCAWKHYTIRGVYDWGDSDGWSIHNRFDTLKAAKDYVRKFKSEWCIKDKSSL